MKFKTYSRKPSKKNKLINQNVRPVFVFNNYVNITNIFNINVSQGNQSKPETKNKSESRNAFDELLRGPIYNQPQSSFLEHSAMFFDKRQETVPFYQSDAELSTSSSISKLLFKDSKDSDIYSPLLLQSPSEYRRVNNKLVKMKKDIKIVNSKKNPKGVQKKRAVVGKKKHLSNPGACASSTPSGPKVLLGKDSVWMGSCVSPIIAAQGVSAVEGINKMYEQSSVHGLTALIEGLGNLGFQTPHRKKSVAVASELFDYESPAQVMLDRDGSRNSSTDATHKELRGIENSRGIEENVANSPKILINLNSSKSAEEISSCKLGVSTPNQKTFEEEEKDGDLEPEQLISKSLDQENSGSCSTISSPRYSEQVSINEELLGCNKLSPVLTIESTNESKNETYSPITSLSSFEENNSNSSSEMKLISVSIMTENTEKHSDSSSLNSSLPVPEDKSSQQSLEEAVDYSHLIKTMGENQKTQESKKCVVSLNLEPGKKWRRSFLRQKASEAMCDSRRSISTNTLVKLIRESSTVSGFSDTKITCSNMTGIIDSLMGNQELESECLPIKVESPGFNMSFSKLRYVYTRRRFNYVSDMKEISEEICDHLVDEPLNETKLCEQESVVQQCQEDIIKSVDDTSADQTNIYDTPPILKVNSEALSAITDRKRSRRFRSKSLDECSIYSDVSETYEREEENDFFTSCCSKLEDDVENLNDMDIQKMGEVGFLLQVGQPEGPKPFADVFPDQLLKSGGCQKIGEGVFGEVFVLDRPDVGKSVLKIIPIEGVQLVNNERQKRFDEVLSEVIITEELSMLRRGTHSCTSSFCELRGKFCLRGEYPAQLLQLWHKFDSEKGSENECPDMFGEDQVYLALELAHSGDPVDSFPFKSPQEALAGFLQTTFALAVGESVLNFEHRDLHIGNILIQKTSEKHIPFKLNGMFFECPTYGSKVTIIDYTLSRVSFKGDVLYLDLENDPGLFTASGDYQFDIYRHMREDLNSDWRAHQPKTNVRWLHYLIDKLTGDKFKYQQKKTTKSFKENIKKMARLKEMILDFYSAFDLALHLIHSYSETMSLIRLHSKHDS